MATSHAPQQQQLPLGRAFAVALVALLGVIVATFFAVRSGSESELDTTAPDSVAEPGGDAEQPAPGDDPSDSNGRTEPSSGDGDATGDDAGEPAPATDLPAVPERPVQDAGFDSEAAGGFFGGETMVVHGEAGFASLHWVDERFVARRSTDGMSRALSSWKFRACVSQDVSIVLRSRCQ